MPPPWALPRGPPVHGLPAQPVVEVCDQPALAPVAEEGADPTPAGKVRGHRLPRDPARDQVTDHVQQLPVTVTLGRSAPPPKPGRHRQQRPDGRPFRVRHVGGIPAFPVPVADRVAVRVREVITRSCSRVGREAFGGAQQRHQGLPALLGWIRILELPRGPVFIRVRREDHPGEKPVRPARSMIGSDTASETTSGNLSPKTRSTEIPSIPMSQLIWSLQVRDLSRCQIV